MNPTDQVKRLIAPCGMNCATCIAYLRSKKPCLGCRTVSLKQTKSCSITKCEHLLKTSSGFCFECNNFPCRRINNLDKRYRTKYHISFIENLRFIQKNGLDRFVTVQIKKWTCTNCNEPLCAHRTSCLQCGDPVKH